jgi:hypothetical protein
MGDLFLKERLDSRRKKAYLFVFIFSRQNSRKKTLCARQGDQIGQISTYQLFG